MKVQEVILRGISKQIRWTQAAEIIGVSPRTMRRWLRRYEAARLRRAVGSASEAALTEAGSFGDGGEGAGVVSGQVPGVERGPFRGEASGGGRDRSQLQLGEEGVAGSGIGPQAASTGQPPEATAAATVEGDAAACGREPARLVGRGWDPGSDCGHGRCRQCGLLRPVGGGGEHSHGDGGLEGGGGAAGTVLRPLHGSGQPLCHYPEGGRGAGSRGSNSGGASLAAIGNRVGSGSFTPGSGTLRTVVWDLAGPACLRS